MFIFGREEAVCYQNIQFILDNESAVAVDLSSYGLEVTIMPILLWLLGVPLSVVILLLIFHVI